MNHRPAATAGVLEPSGTLIPNSIGNTGRLLAGLPRMARARVMRSANVKFVTCVVNRANLDALVSLLSSGGVRVVVDATYPLGQAPTGVARMLSHRAAGKVVICV